MIVIDTSVGIKLLNPQEKGSETAKKLLEEHYDRVNEIVIPNYFYIEAANAIATKKLSDEQIISGIKLLIECNFGYHPVSEDNLIRAALLAKKYRVSVYDMLYAVIAEANKAKLITADEKFVKKVKLPYIELLSE